MSRRTPIGFGKYVTVNSPSQVARQTFARLSLPGVPRGRALVSDPEPGKAGEDDLKPLLHKARKWLSGPDAGAERVTTRVGYIKARSR